MTCSIPERSSPSKDRAATAGSPLTRLIRKAFSIPKDFEALALKAVEFRRVGDAFLQNRGVCRVKNA